jgi:hypothetical protein
MRKFTYRTPRYTTDLPVYFKVNGTEINGRCREIGFGGVTVELAQRVPEGTSGTLKIRYRDIAVDLPVRVAHSESGSDGLKFNIESHADRESLARLIAHFSAPGGQDGPAVAH